MDVAAWLQGLGLERYIPAFRDNEIDWDALPKLSADDLKDLGVVLGGHRRRLLDAIAALGAAAPAASATAAPRDAPAPAEAERRQLTVMFCDLVGSTALSSQLDPEDLREVIAAYHRAVAGIVTGFDGFVSRYMGDGVLIYFGYPQAHEDDAERAVRAGLSSIDAVGRLDVKSVKLQARVGIATGLVVVGDLIGAGSAQEQSVVGETPNLAARLQSLAEPDAVVIAAGTRRLVGDLFEYRDLGAVEVKGIAAPVPAWSVLRPSGVESRFEALRGSALSPLVGRNEEIDLLLRRWQRVKAGGGQVVLISGEAGLGKSRITAALEERLRAEPHLRLRYFCSPYHQDSALFPFTDQLDRAAGFAREDPPAARLEKLEAVLARAAPSDEDVAFLADLLCLPCSERCPMPNLSPQRKKERTLEALIRQLEGLARQQPVIMVFEDAHWIDPTSRELLDLTVERMRSLPVLLIVTFRPEFQPPWIGQPQVSMLTLNRLDRGDRTALVAQIAGGKALPGDVIDQIVDRSDGVPLFVEELTKSVLESGLLREERDRYALDRSLPPLAIPTTLHASLLARLDRLASVRLVAQIGAAIGRQFPYVLLRAVSDLPEDELRAALARLVASELVFQRGSPPDAVYTFKHALVQDAAHGSLLRSTRRHLHAQIANALETHSPEVKENQPELLAYHFTQADLSDRALDYWRRASLRAFKVSANVEALAHAAKGLGLVGTLPRNAARMRQELLLQILLGQASVARYGFGASSTTAAYSRARVIAEELSELSLRFAALAGLWTAHYVRAAPEQRVAAREILTLSEQYPTRARLCAAHRYVGGSSLVCGELLVARYHLERAVSFYDPNEHQFSALSSASMDIGVSALAELACPLWLLGYPHQAARQTANSLALALRVGHKFTIGYALFYSALRQALDRRRCPIADASKLLDIAESEDFSLFCAAGQVISGWSAAQQGNIIVGIERMSRGLAAWTSTGAEIFRPFFLYLLAEAYVLTRDTRKGLAAIDEAIATIEWTKEHWVEAEVHRLRGELLLALKDDTENDAEAEFQHATEVARGQSAKLWELRAAMSLARLRRDQGCRAEARDLLAPVYGWFTEGFDTPDLKEAKALLDELT